MHDGTDTAKFKRTPEMAEECVKRYPCATPDNAFVVRFALSKCPSL